MDIFTPHRCWEVAQMCMLLFFYVSVMNYLLIMKYTHEYRLNIILFD